MTVQGYNRDAVRNDLSRLMPDAVQALGYHPLNCRWLYFPINLRTRDHWVLGAIGLQDGVIEVWDSLHGDNADVLRNLRSWVMDAANLPGCLRPELAAMNWQLLQRRDCPQQDNGTDCGVFCCGLADTLSRQGARGRPRPVHWRQAAIPMWRHRILADILNNYVQSEPAQ